MEPFIQFVNAPKHLMLASFSRALLAIHHRFSGESSSDLSVTVLGILVLTAVIWQCYFAFSLKSIKIFLHYWKFCTTKQRIVSPFLVLTIVCAPLFVANGLLEFMHGLPPSVPMRVFHILPAVLWTIPVILISALVHFQAANGVQLKQTEQMQEVVIAHIFTSSLYCIFLMNFEEDAVVGSSAIAIPGMLGVALVGFVIQLMYMRSHSLHGRVNGDIEQDRLAVDLFKEPQAGGGVEFEEQSTLPSEIVLSAIAIHQVSTEHELVTPPPYNPPRVSHKDELVIHGDRPVPLRRMPDAVCRFPAHFHNFVYK